MFPLFFIWTMCRISAKEFFCYWPHVIFVVQVWISSQQQQLKMSSLVQEKMCLVESLQRKWTNTHYMTSPFATTQILLLKPSVKINHCWSLRAHKWLHRNMLLMQALREKRLHWCTHTGLAAGTSISYSSSHLWWFTAMINQVLLPTMSSVCLFDTKQQKNKERIRTKQEERHIHSSAGFYTIW